MMRFRVVTLFLLFAGVPLAHGQSLVLSQIAAGGGYTTEISLLNADLVSNADSVGRLSFYLPDGSPWVVQTTVLGTGSSFDLTIPFKGSRRITVVSSGDVAVGSARFVPTNAIVVGGAATYTFGSAALGVVHSVSTSRVFIPLIVKEGFANGVAVTNTSATANMLQFDVVDSAGQVTSGNRIPLAINGQIARFVNQELGFSGPIAPGSTLRVTSTGGNFGALSLVIGNGYISSGSVYSELETPMFLPQIALGGGYQMQISVFNPFTFPVGGTLRFRNKNGEPAQVSVRNLVAPAGTTITDAIEVPSLAPMGSTVWEITPAEPNATVSTGLAEWTAYNASNPVSRIPVASGVSATIFNGPVHVGQTGTTPYHTMLIPVDVGVGRNTGLALANPGFEGSPVTRILYDSTGSTLFAAPTLDLAAGAQQAEYATETFSGMGAASGMMVISTNGAFGFVGLPLLDSRGVFSSTAAVRAVTLQHAQLAGSYLGGWNNANLGRSGPLQLTVTPNANGHTIIIDADGPVFAGANPPLETWTCTMVFFYSSKCLGIANSPTFGLAVFDLKSDGTLFVRSQPVAGITSFSLDGLFMPASGRALYTLKVNGTRSVGTANFAK